MLLQHGTLCSWLHRFYTLRQVSRYLHRLPFIAAVQVSIWNRFHFLRVECMVYHTALLHVFTASKYQNIQTCKTYMCLLIIFHSVSTKAAFPVAFWVNQLALSFHNHLKVMNENVLTWLPRQLLNKLAELSKQPLPSVICVHCNSSLPLKLLGDNLNQGKAAYQLL